MPPLPTKSLPGPLLSCGPQGIILISTNINHSIVYSSFRWPHIIFLCQIQAYKLNKNYLKMLSVKWKAVCSGLMSSKLNDYRDHLVLNLANNINENNHNKKYDIVISPFCSQ